MKTFGGEKRDRFGCGYKSCRFFLFANDFFSCVDVTSFLFYFSSNPTFFLAAGKGVASCPG